MQRIESRSLVKPALLCALVTLLVLLLNPVDSIWVTTDQLTLRNSDQMAWTMAAVVLLSPVAGGLVTGFAIGRQDGKQYRPMMKGVLATVGGLIAGLIAWGLLGIVIHGLKDGFASLGYAGLFLLIGSAIGGLIGGFTARKVAWGVVII
jgi:hypothetical protein